MSDILELASRLIAIDSRNTVPLECRERPATEEAMCSFLEEYCRNLGLACERQEAAPHRPVLIARGPRQDRVPTLAFEAHMDTVGTEGMTIPPFEAQVRDGCLYGRGACDTKGGMAAMLVAIERILRRELPINLLFIASCAEETGCEGAPHIDLSAYPVDWIVVGEPTSNQPIVGHKANACFELICRGKAAHGARPEAGCNAIYRMIDIVTFLRREIIPELAAHPHPDFTGSTLSVNMINGGVKANIVPDQCRLIADLRLVPGGPEPEKMMAAIVERASHALGFPVETGWSRISPGLNTPKESVLVKAAEAARNRLGLDAVTGSVSYCTDAGVFAAKGYPCIVMGPGNILQAHSAVEYVELNQLYEAVDIYESLAHELAERA